MSLQVVLDDLFTSSINWGMRATGYGEIRVPFSLHVQPAPTRQAASEFPLFSRLPRELQLYTLQFCDSATLFQLMQVCSGTRKEAQKLFWAQPDVWYLIDGRWLLSGGLMGFTYDAADAVGSMQRVEIDFGCIEPFPKVADEHEVGEDEEETGMFFIANEEYTVRDRTRKIQKIWQAVQHHLPHATHVVFSDRLSRRPGGPLPHGLRKIVEQCPPGIHAYVASLRHEAGYTMRLKKSLWKPVRRSCDTRWETVYPTWTQKIVLPPPKTFSGPVGAYTHLECRAIHQHCLRSARRLILLQAVETHYTENPCPSFICPATRCRQEFKVPRDWVLHAIDARHNNKDIIPPGEQLQTFFAQYDARLERMAQQDKKTLSDMRVAWGEEGSQQRREAEGAFLYQLEHDPLYAHIQTPKNTLVWHDYVEAMDNVHFCIAYQ